MTDTYAYLKLIFKSCKLKNLKFKNFKFEITLDGDGIQLTIHYDSEKIHVSYVIEVPKPKRLNFETELTNKIAEIFHLAAKSEKQSHYVL